MVGRRVIVICQETKCKFYNAPHRSCNRSEIVLIKDEQYCPSCADCEVD